MVTVAASRQNHTCCLVMKICALINIRTWRTRAGKQPVFRRKDRMTILLQGRRNNNFIKKIFVKPLQLPVPDLQLPNEVSLTTHTGKGQHISRGSQSSKYSGTNLRQSSPECARKPVCPWRAERKTPREIMAFG